jgi:ribosomal protein L10
MSIPRYFTGKKAFQYNWYMKILNSSTTSPLIFVYHNDFTSQKLIKLRRDITAASNRSKPSLSSPSPAGIPAEPVSDPLLTVIRSSIFGAALRDFPAVDNADVIRMTEGVKGALAVLSLPVLDPPQLKAILRTFDRNVPPRKPKTEEQLKKELEEKNADPVNPGRRIKKLRQIVDPELKVIGALLDGQILLPDRVKAVADLPTLQTLREQLVGLLSSPATQLAMTLSEASGGRLARTLEGLKKGLEETSGDVPSP